MRTLLAIAACAIILVVGRSGARAENAFPKIERSIALIGGFDRDGALSQIGTSFCISSDGAHTYLLTNNHVVTDDNDDPVPRLIVIFAKDMYAARPARHEARIVRRSDDPDLAIVEVDAGGVPAVHLSPTLPAVGDDIAIAGFPYTEAVLWGGLFSGHGPLLDRRFPPELRASEHKGSVSAIHGGSYYIQYDALTDSGNSGGPLFNPSTGEVFGIVQASTEGSREERGLPSTVRNNLAISLEEGWRFIARAPIAVHSTIASSHFMVQHRRCSAAQGRFEKAYGRWAHARAAAASPGLTPAQQQLYATAEKNALSDMQREARTTSVDQALLQAIASANDVSIAHAAGHLTLADRCSVS